MKGIKIWQAGLWVIIFVINMVMMTRRQTLDTALFEVLCVIIYALIFYANTLFIFPRYYEKNKIRYWMSGFLISLVGFIIIEIFAEIAWGSHHHRGKDWIEKILSFKQVLWIILVFLTGTLFSIQDLLARQIINREKLIEEKLQTELQLLKARINPHFLFNALNNIYSLTYLKSDKAPDSVLKLSEMLRYVMEDCRYDEVPLKDEITYILNYIEFQKLRFPGERNIKAELPSRQSALYIAPMLFIPFIENCFKYSRLEEDPDGFVSITISESGKSIIFNSSNSVFRNRQILKGSGTGIENVRRRLAIVYPDRYNLQTELKDNEYIVELKIDLP